MYTIDSCPQHSCYPPPSFLQSLSFTLAYVEHPDHCPPPGISWALFPDDSFFCVFMSLPSDALYKSIDLHLLRAYFVYYLKKTLKYPLCQYSQAIQPIEQ